MSVPIKRVLEVCCKHCKTVLVNVHLTTKVHQTLPLAAALPFLLLYLLWLLPLLLVM
jgi:hypothetical protein